jgi:hypothetical protein
VEKREREGANSLLGYPRRPVYGEVYLSRQQRHVRGDEQGDRGRKYQAPRRRKLFHAGASEGVSIQLNFQLLEEIELC